MNVTKQLLAVAVELMRAPSGRHYGYPLRKAAKIHSGTLYPILNRLLAAGWLESEWEDPSSTKGRPARRYYTLTDLGRLELGELAKRAT